MRNVRVPVIAALGALTVMASPARADYNSDRFDSMRQQAYQSGYSRSYVPPMPPTHSSSYSSPSWSSSSTSSYSSYSSSSYGSHTYGGTTSYGSGASTGSGSSPRSESWKPMTEARAKAYAQQLPGLGMSDVQRVFLACAYLDDVRCVATVIEHAKTTGPERRAEIQRLYPEASRKAVSQHALGALRLLLDAGLSPDLQTSSKVAGDRLIHDAVASGDVGLIALLAKHGAELDAPNGRGQLAETLTTNPQVLAAIREGYAQVAFALEAGDPLKRKPARALALYERACSGGSKYGCYGRGRMLAAGSAGAKDEAGAIQLFQSACPTIPAACAELGGMFEQGRGGPSDPVRAKQAYTSGCTAKDAYSCESLGWLSEGGMGMTRDTAEATRNYQLGCDLGAWTSCSALGRVIFFSGSTSDGPRALAAFQKACDRNPAGCGWLAVAHLEGGAMGITRDPAAAVPLARKACDASDAQGCTMLGLLFHKGEGGLSVDLPKAAELFQRACDSQHRRACAILGIVYDEGKGVAKDRRHAYELFERSCEAKDPYACSRLGQALWTGLPAASVKADRVRATKLLGQACDAGEADACKTLGRKAPAPAR